MNTQVAVNLAKINDALVIQGQAGETYVLVQEGETLVWKPLPEPPKQIFLR